MFLVDTLILLADAAYGLHSWATKRELSRLCALETVDLVVDTNKKVGYGQDIISVDGDYLSIIKINGSRSLLGKHDLSKLSEDLERELVPFLSRSGYALQSYFVRDPERAKQVASRTIAQARKNSREKGLNVDFILNERENLLPRYLVDESCYMALWTRSGALTNAEVKHSNEEEKRKVRGAPLIRDGQFVLRGRDALRDKHRAYVQSFVTFCQNNSIMVTELDVADQLRAVRSSVYTELETGQWSPRLPLDGMKMRDRVSDHRLDFSQLLPPPLYDQITARDAETIDTRTAKIGDRYYSSLDMGLMPSDILGIGSLVERVNFSSSAATGAIPWRMSVLIEGGADQAISMKSLWAMVPAVFDAQSKRVKASLEYIKDEIAKGNPFVKLRVNFATWADDEDILKKRSLAFMSAIEGWGNPMVNDLAGDPVEAVTSSSLGLSVSSTAEPAFVDIYSAMNMLPLGRMASPFARGTMSFRTPDGKAWPYQTGSSLQNLWLDIIAAPPGSGKSVLMNLLNLTTCMSPPRAGAASELPYIITLDIGPSSQGLVTLLQETLPHNLKHLAQYVKLQNHNQYAMNVFDTQLGCRFPMSNERDFISNFLQLILSPGGTDDAKDISGVVTMIIQHLYEYYSDEQSPKQYTSHVSVAVDRALARHPGLVVDKRTSWWEVVDYLFEKNELQAAKAAQRHAVPILPDVAFIVQSQVIKDIYGEDAFPSGEPMIKAINRLVSERVQNFPIFSQPTKFDTSARILAINLEEVAPAGDGAAARQTAAMYMLGRYLARDFFLGDPSEQLHHYPEKYRGYHMKRLTNMAVATKRLVYDEAHRPFGNKIKTPVAQMIRDAREGRKYGVEFLLASQIITDFPSNLLDLATCYWIMGSPGSESKVDEMARMIGLNSASCYVISNHLTGPGRAGAPFVLSMKTKNGTYQHHLYATLGPVELWCFSTTADDVSLRKILFEKIGVERALRALGQKFSSGSAKADLENRIEELELQGVSNAADVAFTAVMEELLTIDARNYGLME